MPNGGDEDSQDPDFHVAPLVKNFILQLTLAEARAKAEMELLRKKASP